MISLIQTAVLVGLLYSLFTLGIALSFRVLNYPDLTLEGSVIIGGAAALNAVNHGLHPIVAITLGALAGALAGLFTAIQSLYLGVSRLLSGIITAAILYSLTIRFLGGKANVRFSEASTLFDRLNPGRGVNVDIAIQAVVILLVIVACTVLFKTRLGLLLRVIGDNECFAVSLGQNPKMIMLYGLALSNAIVGLGGALLVQYKNTVDVNMSFGLLLGALASLILGETFFSSRSLAIYLVGSVLGTISYNFAIALVLFSWSPNWEQYVMASDVRLIAGLLLVIPSIINKGRLARVQLFRSDW